MELFLSTLQHGINAEAAEKHNTDNTPNNIAVISSSGIIAQLLSRLVGSEPEIHKIPEISDQDRDNSVRVDTEIDRFFIYCLTIPVNESQQIDILLIDTKQSKNT